MSCESLVPPPSSPLHPTLPHPTRPHAQAIWPLAALLQGNTTLRSLALGPQRLLPADAARLSQALASSGVSALDASGCMTSALTAPPARETWFGAVRARGAPAVPLSPQEQQQSAALMHAFTPLLGSPSLRSLRLAGCAIGEPACVLLCNALRAAPKLQLLDLSDNQIGTDGALALADLVHLSASLHHLDLSANRLDEGPLLGLTQLCESVGTSQSLEHLEWQACCPAPTTLTEPEAIKRTRFAELLSTGLAASRSLTSLDLTGLMLGTPGPLQLQELPVDSAPARRELRVGGALGGAVRAHWPLVRLSLAGLRLHDAAVAALVGPLHDHPALRELDLSRSSVGRAAAAGLAALLLGPCPLGSLALQEVGLCAEGAVTLCTALAQSSKLHTLDLSSNSIGVSDGVVVVPAPAPPADAAVEGEEEGAAAPAEVAADGEEAPSKEAPPPPPPPPAMQAALALARVFKQNCGLRVLKLAGGGLEQAALESQLLAMRLEEEREAAEAKAVADKAAAADAAAAGGEAAEGEAPPTKEGEGEAAEGQAAAAPPPPPPPTPLLGAVLGEGLAEAGSKSSLQHLDLSGNALGDAGAAALAAGLKGAAALHTLFMRGCCGAGGVAAVAEGVKQQGAIVLSDLVELPAEEEAAAALAAQKVQAAAFSTMVSHQVACYVEDPGSAASSSLQLALASNRWEHALLWEELLSLAPADAADAATRAFRALPGASASHAPLHELLRRLVPPQRLAALEALPPDAQLPFGGYVQWLADCFASRWEAAAGPSGELALLLRAMASPDAASEEGAGSVGAPYLRRAAAALVAQSRRYFVSPKAKPRPPADPEAVGAAALEALGRMAAALQALRSGGGGGAEGAEGAEGVEGGEPAEPAERAEPAEGGEGGDGGAAGEGGVGGVGGEPSEEAAMAAIAALCAHGAVGGRVSAMHELLHPTLPPDLYVSGYEDVLVKTYRIELQAALRVADQCAWSATGRQEALADKVKGAMPNTTRHDKARCFVDDWSYFLQEKAPLPWREWMRCLRWLQYGGAEVLARAEVDLHGEHIHLTEAMIERPFSAGIIRCTLTKVDGLTEAGEWLLSGLQVAIDPAFIPAGPLLTWHDTEPFDDDADPAPPPPPREPTPEPEPEPEPAKKGKK